MIPNRRILHLQFLFLFLAVGLGGLLYANTLNGPFILDDHHNIRENPLLRVTSLSPAGLCKAAFNGPSANRPLAYLSFALNYYFHQYELPGYHLVNIAIHIINTILLFFLVAKLLALAREQFSDEQITLIAMLAALLWLVHPLHSQSVTYVVQRMNSLAALFYLLSLLAYLSWRSTAQKGTLFLCLFSGLLALGSKETAATLPLIIVLIEHLFFQDMNPGWLSRRRRVLLLAAVGFATLCFFFLGSEPWTRITAAYDQRPFTMAERLLTQWRVLIFYLSLLIFPHPGRLNLDHHFSLSHSMLAPTTTIFSLLGLLLLLSLALYLLKRQRIIAFGILWFLINNILESSIIGLELIFEHRTYLPSMLLIPALVLACVKLLGNKRGLIPLAMIIVLFSWWTHERNQVWRTPVSLWQDAAAKAPQKARPHASLGGVLLMEDHPEEAMVHLRRALELEPQNSDALCDLGIGMMRVGRLGEARQYLTRAAARGDSPKSYYNLGMVLEDLGHLQQAGISYQQALARNPMYGAAHNNLGILLARQGRLQDAIPHFRAALRADPLDDIARRNLEYALKSIRN